MKKFFNYLILSLLLIANHACNAIVPTPQERARDGLVVAGVFSLIGIASGYYAYKSVLQWREKKSAAINAEYQRRLQAAEPVSMLKGGRIYSYKENYDRLCDKEDKKKQAVPFAQMKFDFFGGLTVISGYGVGLGLLQWYYYK